jgi:hypothetical protein
MDRIRQKKYGMYPGQFEDMWASQNGHCMICPGELTRDRFTHVDHDHTTGAVRALLCHNCNLMLGHARDDANILLSGAAYLLGQDSNAASGAHGSAHIH